MVDRRAIDRVRGTQDYWAGDAEQLDALRVRLEETFRLYGYRRVEVPALELAELHLRKSGLEIISKLYSFTDLGGRQLCLRPELTASIVRAFVAHPAPRLPLKLFGSGPVFRYERPARGRYRQFTQCGVELIGAEGVAADAEAILLATDCLDRLGLREYTVTIGHVGILSDLLAHLGLGGRLRAYLLDSVEEIRRRGPQGVRERLADLDPELFETDGTGAPATATAAFPDASEVREAVAGVLTRTGRGVAGRRSDDEVVERMVEKLRQRASGGAAVERAIGFIERLGQARGAPSEALAAGRALLAEYELSDAPLRILEETVGLLQASGAPMDRLQLDLGLSRGLQYYTGTVFEIDHAGLGAESQLCGGGRYDDLVRALGGRQPVPALGFAFGVERVKLALESEGHAATTEAAGEVFVMAAARGHAGYTAQVAQTLRCAGVPAHVDVAARPLRAALAYADREGFAWAAIVGDEEARTRTVRLRDMRGGSEQVVPLASAGAALSASVAGESTTGGGRGK